MRLFDADELEKVLPPENILGKALQKTLKKIKPIDPVHAVGGVYCRECEYYYKNIDTMWCAFADCRANKNDFCSHGLYKDRDKPHHT